MLSKITCRLIFFTIILFSLTNFVSAQVTNITSCGTTISSPGIYELNDTLNGTATCLTVTSSHVSIDCKRNSILYGAGGAAGSIGINSILGVVPLTNLTVKNCIIQDINSSGTTGYGIMMTRTSDSYIFNNTIFTNGSATNHGIFITTSSSDNLIENNTINALGSSTANYGIHLISNSNRNIIRGNVVDSTGTTTSYAIYVSTSSGFISILNNSLSTTSTAPSGNTDGHALYVLGSNNNIIEDNYIYGRSLTRNYLAYFSNVNNISFTKNKIVHNATGATNYGLYGLYMSNSIIRGNDIWVSGTTTNYGVYLSSATENIVSDNNVTPVGASVIGIYGASSQENEFANNVVSATGSGATNYGIYLLSSYNSQIKNNQVNVTGTTPLYGIYLLYSEINLVDNNTVTTYGTTANSPMTLGISANENKITNNTFESRGTSTLNYGVYITQNIKNIVEKNNITTNGTTTNYGVYLLTNVKATKILNNLISTFGTTTNYGIFLSGANRNDIVGNNITTNGTTKSGTTNNWGIHFAVNSEDNEIHNNTIITDGGGLNYGLSLITSSLKNIYSGNRVYPGGNGASNIGAYVSESHHNTFQDNLFSTSGTATSYGSYLHSSSRNNSFTNNNITTIGGSNSHAFHFLFVTPGYPESNNLKNNYLYNISGRDFNFGTASINGTKFIDQVIGDYSFTGVGGTINVENSSAGTIRFLNNISGTNTLFSDKIFLNDNFARIDETIGPLNRSAEITLYNISTTSTQLQIMRNGEVCPAETCQNLTSMQAGNVIFNVTHGGNYSIESSTSSPIVTLNKPENNFNATRKNIQFNFSATDDISTLINCSIYLDNSLNSTNSTVSAGNLTNIIISNINEGIHSWYVSCYDSGGNLGLSETRNFNLTYTIPTINLNSPSNETYLNNGNQADLNFSVYDNDLNNITAWLYGNDTILNVYYNLTNGSNILYSWQNLSIRQYNWSIILNNNLKNSSTSHRIFNIINLTINCESGGPYQSGALVLAQGNVTDGLNALSAQSINATLYQSSTINSSRLLNSLSDGSFQTTFSNLVDQNYTLNYSVTYHGNNATCTSHFNISASSGSTTSASLVLDKIVSLHDLTSTNITYNITLATTNTGGSSATNLLLNDTDSADEIYNLGTLFSGIRNQTSYLKTYPRNSTNYNISLAIARVNGTDTKTGNEIDANSSSIIFIIPATTANTNLTITKNAQYVSENSTNVIYNLTSTFVNSGGSDMSEINITDSDISLNSLINLNISQTYSVSGLKTLNKASSSQSHSFVRTNASHNSINYSSNQIVVLVPGMDSNSSLLLSKSASIHLTNSTNVIYNITLSLTNIGERNATDAFIYDSNSSSSPYNIGTIISSQTIERSYLMTFSRGQTNSNHQLSIATANATDSISGNLINTSSNSLSVLVPATLSSASLVLDKIVSLHDLTSTNITYNITLKIINSGGSSATNTNLNDTNSQSSPYDLGTITAGGFSQVSYSLNYTRNSTNYNVSLSLAMVNATDSQSGNQISANSSIITIVIPATIANTNLTLIKNAQFLTENSTSITYNLTVTAVNSGGNDLTSINISDADISLNALINLNRTQYYLTSGSKTITKISTSQTYNFLKANATQSSDLYESNQLQILIPALATNSSLTLSKLASLHSQTNINITYNITLSLVNSGGSNSTNANITDSDSASSPYLLNNLTAGQTIIRSYLFTLSKSASSVNYALANASAYGIDSISNNLINVNSSELIVNVPAIATNASLILIKTPAVKSLNDTTIVYNITLSLVNSGGSNSTNANITDSDSASSPYLLNNLTAGQTIIRSYLLNFSRTNLTSIIELSNLTAYGIDSISNNLISSFANKINITIPSNLTYIPSSASLNLDKIASVYNFTNETFIYNITLRLTNRGESNSINTNITDINYNNSYFEIGDVSAGSTISRSYLLNFTRNSTTYYSSLSIAQTFGIDTYSNYLIIGNSSITNITIPSSEIGQQITLVKNAYFNSENSTAVNYTLSLEIVNSGGMDLNSINVIDTDLNVNNNINLNRIQNYTFSGTIIVSKAASNTEKTFVKASATVNSIAYQSNQIKVNIPGYGGPADTIVYAPSSVNASTSFDSIIQIINQNPDIGQNFIVDYWITNESENFNYTSGQQTIYVASLGTTNVTATLTSPSVNGTYRLRALVSYVGGPDIAFDSFEVGSSNNSSSGGGSSGGSGSSSSGGGSTSDGGNRITGNVVDNIICNSPYIRYGDGCCLDTNNNSVCDVDENFEINKSHENKDIQQSSKKESRLIKFVDNFLNKFKSLSQSLENKISEEKNYLVISSIILTIVIITFILLNKTRNLKNKEIKGLRDVRGLRVYSENGNYIGKIDEIYIEQKKSKIYGLLIKLSGKISKDFGSKNVLLRYKHVNSIKNIIIIDKASSQHLENNKYSDEI